MRQRRVAQERHGRADVIAKFGDTDRGDVGHEAAHLIHMRRFLVVMHQRDQLDLGALLQALEHVKSAQAIAAIGRVGQAMREHEDAHGQADRSLTWRSRNRNTRAGTPPATVRSGMGRVTTAPAPTTASRPTSASTTAALPIQAPAPMRTAVFSVGWSRMGTRDRPCRACARRSARARRPRAARRPR